jgi:hypothetical protein
MNEVPVKKSGRRWRIVRWLLVTLAVLATSVAVFYTEENWRGRRVWESCQREYAARGVELNWDKFIPAPVPDDQNFFKAPKMQEWFVRYETNRFANVWGERLKAKKIDRLIGYAGDDPKNPITNAVVAREFLAQTDEFEADFDLLRAALKRPYARMEGDYTRPAEIPIPNFVNVRTWEQMLAQRAHCHLLMDQPETALRDVMLMRDLCRLLEGAPSGKPMTLVAAMINVAVTSLYVPALAEGLQRHVWHNEQLVALQNQLAETDLTTSFQKAFESEPAGLIRTVEITPPASVWRLDSVRSDSTSQKGWWRRFWDGVKTLPDRSINWVPHGWVYQNMVNHVRLSEMVHESMFDTNQLVTPGRISQASRQVDIELGRGKWFYLLAARGLPNYTKALQAYADRQTKVNQAQIACALERYYLVNHDYPETLAGLVPQYIAVLPRDLIGGQPLHYRRTEPGQFLLYSVGWNETDDGGVTVKDKNGNLDKTQGDWVWQYPLIVN